MPRSDLLVLLSVLQLSIFGEIDLQNNGFVITGVLQATPWSFAKLYHG